VFNPQLLRSKAPLRSGGQEKRTGIIPPNNDGNPPHFKWKGQDMRTRLLLVVGFVLVLAGVAMAGDPFIGTWKLNVAQSKFTPGPGPRIMTIKIEATENGYKRVTVRVDAEGKASHSENTGIIDGKEHPITGNPNYDAYS
jgi:hypothetical protein